MIRVAENTTFERIYAVDNQEDLSFAVEAGATLKLVLVVLPSNGRAAGRVHVALEGPGAEAHLAGLILAGAGERTEIYTDIEHLTSDCISTQDFRGVAAGDGTGVFDGRIRVAPDAQRTRAFQKSNNLILSDFASIEARPHLEIYADDVKCSHGATVGQLDPQALFYLRQRGIGEHEARKLQLQGFVHEIVSRIPSPEIEARVAARIGSF